MLHFLRYRVGLASLTVIYDRMVNSILYEFWQFASIAGISNDQVTGNLWIRTSFPPTNAVSVLSAPPPASHQRKDFHRFMNQLQAEGKPLNPGLLHRIGFCIRRPPLIQPLEPGAEL
jgi:hypothetical protein